MKTEKRPFHFLGWSLTGWIGTAALLAAGAVTRSERRRGRKVMNDSTTGLTSSERTGSAILARAEASRGYCLRSAAPAGARHRARSHRPARPGRPAATVLVVGLLLLGAAAAEAQTPRILVSNVSQAADDVANTSGNDHAQLFHTGDHSNGYTLTSVIVVSEDAEGDAFDVEICTADGTSDDFPTTSCTALTAPGSFTAGNLEFTHAGLALSAGTNYVVVVKPRAGANVAIDSTTSGGEDSTGLAAWSIKGYFYWNNGTTWANQSGLNEVLQITVNGYEGVPVVSTTPTVTGVALTSAPGSDNTYGIGDAVEATVTFSEAVDITGTPQLELDFAGTAKAAACATGTNTTTMACEYEVVAGDVAAGGVAIGTNKLTGGTIYATGSTTISADLDHAAVAIDADHKVDGIRPTLVTTGSGAPTTSLDGTKVILKFSETISDVDRTKITIGIGGGNVASTSAASAAGAEVELDLSTVIDATVMLTVALDADAVVDGAFNGNLAVAATPVINAVVSATTPTVTGVALTSAPGSDNTYDIGDAVEATVTFSEAVDITGTPQLELDFAGTAKAAACATGTNTTTMACEYEVVAGDVAAGGVAIGTNKLTGGTIYATGSTTISADLDHAAVAIDADHKVDGIRPTLVTTGSGAPTTSLDGTKVILKFSETISDVDRTKITIGIGGGNVASTSAASAAGAEVELDLSTVIDATVMLTVALDADAVVDGAFNGNLAVAATPVTNAVTANEPPGRPAAPSVSSVAGSTTSLSVNWTAPSNTGPAIDYYDLRYREGTGGSWTTGPQNVSGTSATIAGLTANTLYQVQVLATNAEGDSPWSLPGSGQPGADPVEADRAALEALYNATGGATWTDNTNWLSAETLSEWHGVSTDATGRVTDLNLIQNGLSGAIPAELGDLTNLQNLDLSLNNLSGEIPAELGDLTSLWSLFLWGNNLSGEIPVELGDLTNLFGLDLSQNKLSGEIPVELGDLTNLESLFLSGNKLSGEIPAELGDLTNLMVLDLALNNLSGEIPAELGDLTSLWGLFLSGNKLSGEIPAELGDLTNLVDLDLSQNKLSGEIPAELGNLTNLEILFLWGNELSGEIPSWLVNLTELRELSLWSNQLTGTIPPEAAAAQYRAVLRVLYNSTGGANWTDNTNWLSAEALSEWHGVFTDEQGRIEELRLSANGLTGMIGAELSVLTRLTGLYLNDNELTGMIPPELENLTQLQVFDISNTGLCAPSGAAFQAWLATIDFQGAVCATRPPGGGGGGDVGPRITRPGAPENLVAEGGDGQVKLTWEAPEDDGGSEITDYQYRINGRNPWTSIGSTQTTHTLTGLVNGTAYVFEVRAVNRIGRGRASNRAEVTLPVFVVLDFTHFANGGGITSEMVLVSVATHPIRPALYFYDQQGLLIDPASVVDVTMDLEVTESGSLTVRTGIEPLGVLTIATHGRGELVSGSVEVVSDGPIGGGVRYTVPHAGVTGVGASPPVGDVVFPARRQEGGIRTAASLHNLEEEAVEVSCRLMSGGVALEEVEISLEANGQSSWFIEDAFPMTDTSDFSGSVRCSAAGSSEFTAIAIETDAAQGIYTTLPVMEVDRTGGRWGETVLDFAHLANGDWITDLVFVNLSIRPSGPGLFPFDSTIQPSRPAIYFYDTEGNPIAPGSVVDLTSGLEVTDDGALTVSTAMKPLGQLTIPTHGRGELVTGSVRVVSEGPIGGMLRFEHSAYGAAGVGPGLPLSEAVFPVWRREGGITTGFALHNLEEEAAEVTCDLMREGGVLDTVSLPLEANGQTSWTIQDAFPATDTSDFAGAVRCSAGGGLFTALALEMDSGAPLVTALPVVAVPEVPSPE